MELALNSPLEAHWRDNPARREQFEGLGGLIAHLLDWGKEKCHNTVLTGNLSHNAGVAVDDHENTLVTTTDIPRVRVRRMAVIASLVLGADGSSTLRGNSTAISTPIDQKRFLARRRLCDVIIVGGKTARSESYKKTPTPLVIVSHSRPDLLDANPIAHWWKTPPADAVERAKRDFGPAVSVECGVSMLVKLLDAGAISQLELSISPHSGGENKIDHHKLLSYFNKVEKEVVDETIFFSCTVPIKHLK